MFYKKIVTLCVNKGISLRKMCQDCGIALSAPGKWKNGTMPNLTTMVKIAKYFDVDAEFFVDDSYDDYDEWLHNVKGLTRAEVIRPNNWAEEKTTIADGLDEEFLAMAKQLNPSQLQRVKDFIRGMLS